MQPRPSYIALLLSAWLANGQEAPKAEPGSWTLQTADTHLTIEIDANNQLRLRELSNPVANWNWANPSSPLPLLSRVDVGGKAVGIAWRYSNASLTTGDGSRLTIQLTNAQPQLELSLVWQAWPGPGPIRHAAFIRNRTESAITIYNQETFDLRLRGPVGNTLVWTFNDDGSIPDKIGVYREPLTNGYSRTLRISEEQDYIPFAYVDAGSSHGTYLGWEWSIGRVALTSDLAGEVHAQFGSGDRFQTQVKPGETFEVPPGFIGVYAGDVDDGGNRLRQYLFQHSMPARLREDPGFPKVEWNAFAPTGQGQGSWVPTEKKYYPFIREIAPLGFEEVVIDVGWWSSYGDPGHIVTNPTNWPSGMPAAAKYAHDRGLRFGLYDNEPEDLTTREGIGERISDITFLIRELNADFYRSDSTAGPVLKGSAGAPNSRARSEFDAGYWACKGFYEVIDTVYGRLPGFLWECCSGGGRIKDFGVARRAARIQNQDRYYPLDARQSFYDSSHVLHPMQLAALDGSWAEWQATGSVFEFRSASMGVAYWHPDAPNGGNGGPVWSKQQKAAIRRAVDTYKTKIRPLIRSGYLYHIFPRPDDVVWDGIEYFDPTSQKGVVYIFKPKGSTETQSLRLKGVAPGSHYRLTFEDETNPSTVLSGEALMKQGIPVRLEGTYVSELMFVEKADRP